MFPRAPDRIPAEVAVRRPSTIPILAVLLSGLTFVVPMAHAWQPDGIPVCTAAGPQGPLSGRQVTYDAIVHTYAGLVVGWEDRRSLQTYESDLFVRSLDTGSGPTSDGEPLCVAPGDQTGLALAFGWWNTCGPQHGCGLVIGAWKDSRGGADDDVFANRAFVPWAVDGVPVCRMPGSQQTPAIAMSTGPGGGLEESVIVWEDQRGGSGDIYAQRLDVYGGRMWDTSGVAVCTAAWGQDRPQVVSGPDGRVRVAWVDARDFPSPARIRVTSLEPDGSVTPGWPIDGREVATSGAVQSFRLLPSGHLVWWEQPAAGPRVRATRIQSDGQFAPAWSDSGVAVTGLAGDEALTDAVAGDAGGLLVSWFDITYSITMTPTYTLRVQHLDADGAPMPGWGSDGVVVAIATPWMDGGRLLATAENGAYVTWAAPDLADGGLFLQRLTSTGEVDPRWPAGGASLRAAAGAPADPVLGDTENGVIVAWLDPRDDPADVYAQFVTHWGVVGPAGVEDVPVSAVRLAAPRPNPARGAVTLALELPHTGAVSARVYDVSGRLVRTLLRGPLAAGRHTLVWDGRDGRGAAAPAGVYRVRVTTPDGEAGTRIVRLR